MIFILAPLAEGNLNVSSGKTAFFPEYAARQPPRSRPPPQAKIKNHSAERKRGFADLVGCL
jgi:hypothetical protein